MFSSLEFETLKSFVFAFLLDPSPTPPILPLFPKHCTMAPGDIDVGMGTNTCGPLSPHFACYKNRSFFHSGAGLLESTKSKLAIFSNLFLVIHYWASVHKAS